MVEKALHLRRKAREKNDIIAHPSSLRVGHFVLSFVSPYLSYRASESHEFAANSGAHPAEKAGVSGSGSLLISGLKFGTFLERVSNW